MSRQTSSGNVDELAKQRISRCKCVQTTRPEPYPKRLIRLEGGKVRLVEKFDGIDLPYPSTRGSHYVTLSHCWGSNISDTHNRAKLTRENYQERKNGIIFHTLPRTFRDTILLAARMPRVGHIWIDTLCTIQGDKLDWLEQSAQMGQVYRDAFLNISATAANE
jgi:hypothetical protein